MIKAEEIRALVEADREKYVAEMKPPASPPTWSPDRRSVEHYSVFTWMRRHLEAIGAPQDIRIRCQSFFSRKSRAREDLYELTAEILQAYENGTVPEHRGR
jgi:hypothetical protein